MNTPEQPVTALSCPAFLSSGFRPFFIGAGLWAALSMALWLAMLNGRVLLPTTFDPVSWHAHEALFGYLLAVLAGFLLTAVPTWTGRPALTGWPLLGLFLLWVLGRLAVSLSHYLSPLPVALIDLSCAIVLGAYVLREIVLAANWRNVVVVALVGVFAVGNALFHWEAALGPAVSSGPQPAFLGSELFQGYPARGVGLRTGLAAAIAMISVVGGRIVPAFTRNWLLKRGERSLPAEFGAPDRVAMIASAVALAVWLAMPNGHATGYLLLAAGLAQLLRLSRWRGLRTGAESLVWILHVGYAFVPLGMLAMGTAIVWPGTAAVAAAQHLWMAGAIGVMTLAVMTRATLGHTGRPLHAGAATTVLYVLAIAAVVARLAGAATASTQPMFLSASAVLWIGAFAGFVLLYARPFIGPRQPNQQMAN